MSTRLGYRRLGQKLGQTLQLELSGYAPAHQGDVDRKWQFVVHHEHVLLLRVQMKHSGAQDKQHIDLRDTNNLA